ncbi:MAG: hypothetical protein ACKO86_27985, partial [Dolichospermum sp.]
PRHIVTWFGMNRNDKLEQEDYNHFTDYYEPGTIYLLYVEIGKTLEDLATDLLEITEINQLENWLQQNTSFG